MLSLADEARPKLLDSDPCFLVIAFSLASMSVLSGVHTVWPSRILATLQLEPGSSSERRNLNLGENFSNPSRPPWVSCGPMLGVQKLWDLRIVEYFSDSRQLLAPGTCPML